MGKNITYQSNDVLFKILSENYKNIALSVYGLNLPEIKSMIPNNFPVIKVDEKRSDNIFLLEDGSILLLEYESNTRIEENMLKYIDYILRIITRYFEEEKTIKKIRLVVIYSSDIEEAPEEFNMESLTIRSHNVYMKDYNGDEIENNIRGKINRGTLLSDEDIMHFMLLPFMKRNKEKDKKLIIKDTIELAKEVKDENKQILIIAGLLTASNKYIDEDYAREIRWWLKMTSVDKVYEKEKQDALEKERFEKYQAISLCQDNIIDLLDNKFDKVPVNLVKEIKKIQDVNTLKLISKK